MSGLSSPAPEELNVESGLSLRNPKLRLTILGGLFGVAVSAFGYQLFNHHYISAYGDDHAALDVYKDVDPRSLVADDLTSLRAGETAFTQEVPNLHWRHVLAFDIGDGFFERPFVEAVPNNYGSNADGLGPTYNAPSCEACHMSDGRTEPLPGQGLLVRLSVPGQNEVGGPLAHPAYGGQFGDVGISGVPAEGSVTVEYDEIEGTYGDGTPYTLLKPRLSFSDLSQGPLGDNAMTSARAPLSVFGLGLLEAIPEDTLEAWSDPDDQDGDGISGKINMVWDAQFNEMRPGRFGWKAEQPSLVTQSADAAHNDMGVTSPLHPEQTCTDAQVACQQARGGADPEHPYELDEDGLEALRIYIAFLSVPARGNLDHPSVLRGEHLFEEVGCASCHKMAALTSDDHDLKRLRNKSIQPFTDLLLHDMGPGLSDNRPSFSAEGSEWRTPPLWGIGLLERVNGHTRMLHDGRARNFEEAILWHGGEAEPAKEAFRLMPKEDRDAIVNFLNSL